MKLKIVGFENEIVFNEENISVLVVNNPKCFSHILEELNGEMNGINSNEIFLLDEEGNEFNISKEMYMVFDLFNIDYNSKKILNQIYEIISDNIDKSTDYEIENIITKLRNYIIQEINELPFEFTMKDELEIPEILKLYNLKIDSSSYTSVLERVEILIDIISTMKLARILVIPNLKAYMSNEELIELYKYSLYNDVKLLLIERTNSEILKYEQTLIVDENFNDEII